MAIAGVNATFDFQTLSMALCSSVAPRVLTENSHSYRPDRLDRLGAIRDFTQHTSSTWADALCVRARVFGTRVGNCHVFILGSSR